MGCSWVKKQKSSGIIFESLGECAPNRVSKFQETFRKTWPRILFFLFRLQRCVISTDLYGDSGRRLKCVRWKFVSKQIMNNRRDLGLLPALTYWHAYVHLIARGLSRSPGYAGEGRLFVVTNSNLKKNLNASNPSNHSKGLGRNIGCRDKKSTWY